MTAILAPPANARTSSAGGFVARPAIRKLGLAKSIPGGRLIGVLVVLGAWSAGSALHLLDPRKLSAPWTVVATGWDLIANGTLLPNIGASLTRAVVGLAIGLVIGVVLSLIAGLSRWGEYLIDGPVQLKRSIPSLGLVPLMILWLGIGEAFKIVLIIIGVVIHMYIQMHSSLTAIDKRFVELAEVQRVGRGTFIRQVVLPSSLPGFFLGLRLSVTGAWLYLIVVESVNATDGLGKLMSDAQNYGQSDVILVCLIVYGVFGLVSDTAIRLLERRVLSWRQTISS
ncbi:ABC transporter permease [Tsukamurella sp. 8F]|uniref:ABC transporter permease n=1 Tax=unclassified Tsukamurella TaxID=2633480 RepID=UPI0023B8EF31|nr:MULTISPECIES: ABC transporter permease [unclassified Tsukamurella]MDF0529737.1 ABC transporter permease [Tsukamurella sp. 8J]MDF0586022.1 ABC transporter permease [Tsukamurella sp. 8F]